ncbi:DNA topoisomerase 2 like protein [Verticillium longisporum]|uniref:DNA topoisomerase 2 n=1 Tax=Verticillium longisporum TaxID=100787 RepID=A0A8I2Z8E0_VERLO|nr:DNA topoisomerase 2 like protein [Verticillium longisporum]
MDFSDESMFSAQEESDAFSPETKPKAAKAPAKKAPAAKKPAAKKLTQTTLKTAAAPKKRPVSKKLKKAPAASKSSGNPLAEIENDSMALDEPSAPAPVAKGTKKTVEETYQKLTQLEHIVKRPDTYIGSVERTEMPMWVYNKETQLMEFRKVTTVPGLYKIFDEILVNAADIKVRREESGEEPVTHIKVNIDREAGQISIENNGKGSNYDDDEKKTTGGRNGYGAKLCNVFSTEFTVECQDSANGKRYKQTWTDNMSKMGKAKITSSKSSDFVRITFKPDFKRFSMEGIDDDLEALLYRRVYDMAGTIKGIKVHLNGTVVKPSAFKGYSEMYAKAIAKERASEEGGEPKVTVEMDKNDNSRWDVGFTVSDGSFQHISFVNNIATTSGGTHVNYIADQIVQYLTKYLDKKKKGHALKPQHIRNHIFVFINCRIENPSFNSQTKEQMTTKISSFGSKCVLSEAFLKKVAASDAIQNIMSFAEKKADKMMAKSDGNRRSRINNAKLVDANLAGTKRGHECTLILTEGDSAKSLAVAGRAILDPDRIGVFPLRGKMLNVRDASIEQITKNQEIQNIKQFLGLKHKQNYTDTKGLRYGHLMIMADQDHDGSHIKGLLINFLQVQYPSLLQIPDFFREFITPIVKVWQGKNPKNPQKLQAFFTQPQYEEWKEAHKSEISRWEYKYYKGLGTSSNEDAQVYFTNLDDHLKEFDTMQSSEADLFDLAFSKKKADARKEWLGNFVPGTYLDHSTKSITYNDFVNRELILFSMADNMRSIPSVLDGLKPGQRKVMFACFKRNLIKDQKVVELAGYVSEKAAYHHGEMSLQQTIIGLAQNFVGSNNVNCLEPSGNFGSRLAGGSDAASPRYIHTRLSPFARKIFSVLDEPNLEVQMEDGKPIEPKVYAPIIPMVLCNGADGIGTGWSTSIPNYHPMEIVRAIKKRMGRLDSDDTEGKPFETMMPWFRGWKGTPEPAEKDRYKFNGIYETDDKTGEIIIKELPIRMWTDDFKAKLEEVISGAKGPAWIKDYKEFNDHKNVNFVIQLDEKHYKDIHKTHEGIMERFKLNKQVATSNLVAFDSTGRIRKYEKVEDILEEFYVYRLDMYAARKKHWLGVYHSDYRKLKNQARFIQEIIDGELIVSKKRKPVLVQELRDRKYEAFPKNDGKKQATTEEEDMDASDNEDDSVGGAADYDYLLSLPIWSLTLERLERLNSAIMKKKGEHDALLARSEKDLWCQDLDEFTEEWEAQLEMDDKIQSKINRMGRRRSRKIGAGGGKVGRGKADDDFEPERKRAAPKAKAAAKPVPAAKRFQEQFDRKLEIAKAESPVDAFSDDDFAILAKPKAAPKTAPKAKEPVLKAEESDDDTATAALARKSSVPASRPKPKAKETLPKFADSSDFSDGDLTSMSAKKKKPSASVEPEAEPVIGGRTKRAAAAKARPVFDLSESDASDNDFGDVGDIGQMVHGYKSTKTDSSKELKNALEVKKARGRPAGTKNKQKDDAATAKAPAVKAKAKAAPKAAPKAAAKPLPLSPAAKAYSANKEAKKPAKKTVFSDDDDDSDDMMVDADDAEPSSPPPRPAARGRPGRAAAKKKPTYIIDDDDDSSMAMDEPQDDGFSDSD